MEKSPLLVLNAIRYGDSARIVRTFSPEWGLKSFMVHSLKSKAAGAFRASMLMPLSELEVVVDPRAKGDLGRFVETRYGQHRLSIHEHPIKMTVCTFAAEVLSKVVSEGGEDAALFENVRAWLNALEEDSAPLSTAPHRLLLTIAHRVGCYPNFETYREGRVFDQMEGEFVDSVPHHAHWMNEDESTALYTIAQGGAKVNHALRSSVLEELIGFLRIHHEPFGPLKSLDIIRTVLA